MHVTEHMLIYVYVYVYISVGACLSMTAEVTPGGFNLDSHQEVGWLQLV